MLSVSEARALMLEPLRALPAERVALEDAVGRVLASALIATRDQPPFNASAMDGYALAAGPARDVAIVGEAAAGHAFARRLQAGEAVRISTGAPIPEGADGILIQEDAQLAGARLVGAVIKPGRHVRSRGGDYAAGAQLLEAGRKLDPIAIALAASAGVAHLDVVRRPRVIVLAGGDEIVPPGQPANPAQVYESGSYAVSALVNRWGGEATRGVALPDSEDAIVAAASEAFRACDLLVLIGGASVGPHDHARPALQRLGVDVRVDKIAVRPGKPTWFGVCDAGLVLGLPGNPASAIVCAMLFLRPIVEGLLGRDPREAVATREAVLAAPLEANGARQTYLRGVLDKDQRLYAAEAQDSSLLSVFARANVLIERPASAPAAAAGEIARYLPF